VSLVVGCGSCPLLFAAAELKRRSRVQGRRWQHTTAKVQKLTHTRDGHMSQQPPNLIPSLCFCNVLIGLLLASKPFENNKTSHVKNMLSWN